MKQLRYDRKNLLSVLLEQIQFNLRQIDQWLSMEAFDKAAEYAARLDGLVEVLEIFDCGSTGGFGEGQDGNNRNWTLRQRAEWLLEKYVSLVKTFPLAGVKDLTKAKKYGYATFKNARGHEDSVEEI